MNNVEFERVWLLLRWFSATEDIPATLSGGLPGNNAVSSNDHHSCRLGVSGQCTTVSITDKYIKYTAKAVTPSFS